MKRIFIALSIVVMVIFAIPTSATKPSYINNNEWEVLKLSNSERIKENLLPLSTFDTLQTAALVRATEIVRHFSHTRPDGSRCYTTLDQAGVKYYYAGENIAAGQRSAQEVVTGWMNSPGHKSNIMSGMFRHLGVGYFEADTIYSKYWVQMFVGGCKTTAIAIEGDVLRVSCDLHTDSYIPLENVQTEILPNATVKATYDGFSTIGDIVMLEDGSFADVPKNAWFKKYVDYSVENGIFKGTSKYTFSPNDNITRAQFVQVLANLEGVDTSNRNVTTNFSDVPTKKWFTAAVKWASENKIVNGTGNGKFDPNANVTREQMCVMLVNYAKFKGITLKTVEGKENFADDTSISKWAKAAVYTCQQADIVNGKGAGKFDPQGTGTRAEASVIFTKFHKEYLTK